jgi:hypothetical protein
MTFPWSEITGVGQAAVRWVFAALKSGQLWAGVGIGAAIWSAIHRFLILREFKISKVSVNIPFGLGNMTYEALEQDRVLAWKLYVQLKTRKAALLFNEDHDVIADVYDSLYELFPITRDLLTSVPPREVQHKESIADLILRVQNDGLRPHMTRWQASFRYWWQRALDGPENKGKNPQEVQRQFPEYQELVDDLKLMNTELHKYAEQLLLIAQTTRWRRKVKLAPTKAVAPIPSAPKIPSQAATGDSSAVSQSEGVPTTEPDSK